MATPSPPSASSRLRSFFPDRERDLRQLGARRPHAARGPRILPAVEARDARGARSVGFLIPSNYQVAKFLPNEYAGPPPNSRVRGDEPEDPDRTLELEETYFRGFSSGGPSTNRGYPVRGIAPYGFVPFLLPQTASSQVANSCIPGTANAALPQCALPIAGMTLWELSVEARIQITGPISVAVFCDSGDVSPSVATFRLSHPHVSCGLGGRYDTPVGPVRLDIGYRVNGLQVIGYADELAAARANPENGSPPQLFPNVPLAIAFGIGEAY